MINQLPPSDEAFKSLSGSFINHAFNGIVGGKAGDKAKRIAILLFILILAYAGVEAVKLTFRNNFGKKGLSGVRSVLSILAFILIGYFSLGFYGEFVNDTSLADYGSKDSYFFTAFAYFLFAGFLLLKLIAFYRKRNNSTVHESYRGDSAVLGFLMESGWNQSKVQNLAEPLVFLAVGIFLSPINLLLGLPLVFCAISAWLHYIYEYIRGVLEVRDKLSDTKGQPDYFEQSFSEVTN